jgi:hypothetical protein
MLRQQTMVTFFQLVNVFQRSVTHSRVARAAHQTVTTKARVCCVRVCNFSILAICIILAKSVDLHNLVKIKGVPWLVLSSISFQNRARPAALLTLFFLLVLVKWQIIGLWIDRSLVWILVLGCLVCVGRSASGSEGPRFDSSLRYSDPVLWTGFS